MDPPPALCGRGGIAVRLRAKGLRLGRRRAAAPRCVARLGGAQLQEPNHVAEHEASVDHGQAGRLDICFGVHIIARGEEPVRHLLQRAHEKLGQRPRGERVIEQADGAARLADAPQLPQSRKLLVVVQHAEDEGGDDRIEAGVGKLGAHHVRLEELNPRAQTVRPAARLLQHSGAGIDPDHLGVLGIMRDVAAGAHARIEDAPRQPLEHPRAQASAPRIFVRRIEQIIERGDAVVRPVLHGSLIF
jgi:hypothetical protein